MTIVPPQKCLLLTFRLKICWIIMIDTFKMTHSCQTQHNNFLTFSSLYNCLYFHYMKHGCILHHLSLPNMLFFFFHSSRRFTFGAKCFSDCSVGFHYTSVVNQSKSGLATMIHCMVFELNHLHRMNIHIIARARFL